MHALHEIVTLRRRSIARSLSPPPRDPELPPRPCLAPQIEQQDDKQLQQLQQLQGLQGQLTSPSERCRLGFRAQRTPPGPPGQELQELQLFGPARQEVSDQGLGRRRGRNFRNYRSPPVQMSRKPSAGGHRYKNYKNYKLLGPPGKNFRNTD